MVKRIAGKNQKQIERYMKIIAIAGLAHSRMNKKGTQVAPESPIDEVTRTSRRLVR